MDAAERARTAIGLSAGPDTLAAVAATIRQAEQAARQDERRKLTQIDPVDKPVHSDNCATRQPNMKVVEPECSCGATAHYWMQRVLHERRKVLEEIVEWHQKQVDDLDASGFQQLGVAHRKAVDHFRALAEEVT